jgi:hypothetical protein
MAGQRVDLRTAAELLGISSDAVRKRAKRGTIPYETGVDGKLYVWVDEASPGETDDYPDEPTDRDQGDLVAELRDQVAYMREQLAEEREARRRADTIIAQLTQANAEQARTIRELEPSPTPETRDARETTTEDDGGTGRPAGDTGQSRRSSWWRRFFGFE